MFFQELPGFYKSKFYSTNSLLLLSHIPVERKVSKLRVAEICLDEEPARQSGVECSDL